MITQDVVDKATAAVKDKQGRVPYRQVAESVLAAAFPEKWAEWQEAQQEQARIEEAAAEFGWILARCRQGIDAEYTKDRVNGGQDHLYVRYASGQVVDASWNGDAFVGGNLGPTILDILQHI
jgi:hypothetical protein